VPFWRPRGCVLWLDFLEPKGTTAYDKSGYGNHGTIYGATRARALGRRGLFFDGVDDYARVLYSDELYVTQGNKPFSIGCLFAFWGIVPDDCPSQIVQQMDDVGTGRALINIDVSGYICSWVGGVYLGTGVRVKQNRFYHVCLVYDGVIASLFIDGVLKVSDERTVDEGKVGDTLLSANKFLTRFNKNIISFVRFYNRALSEREIRANYAYFFSHIKRAV